MPLFRRSLSEYLFRRFALKLYSKNLLLDMQLQAKKETLEYINNSIEDDAVYFQNHKDLILYAVSNVREQGLFMEFGVARGKSIRWIAEKAPKKIIHGFDSFEGIPEAWNGNIAGTFHRRGKLPKVPENVKLHIGMFDETLPTFMENHDNDDIAFLHVDCDLYSSTKTIFDITGEHIKTGTIILFDDYYNYPNWKKHEFRGFKEFVEENKIQYEHIAYSVTGQQVAVRILENPTFKNKPAPQED